MSDDGFHEIQLNGKQLVALFMGAAVVLVVAFLLGAQVGRGVRNEKDGPPTADAAAAPVQAQATEALPAVPPAAPPAGKAGAPADAPAKPVEADLSYPSRLEGQPAAGAAKAGPAAKDSATKPDPAPTDAAKSAVKDPPPGGPAKAADAAGAKPNASAAPADPGGTGYVVKVAAYRDRSQADTVAAGLIDKGYAAYVVPSSAKGAALFSVRVGKFKTRKEADAIKARLEKEERFKPLVTR
jgi:DedD protein